MDLAVIYDPNVEMAALVDTDAMRALGPIGIGPDAQTELQAFVTAMPEAVMESTSYDLCRVWAQFWQSNFASAHATTGESDTGTVDTPSGSHSDDETVVTAATGGHTDEPPEAQPADTDVETHASEAPKVVTCFACGGTGTVPGAADGETSTCNLCNGVGKIRE